MIPMLRRADARFLRVLCVAVFGAAAPSGPALAQADAAPRTDVMEEAARRETELKELEEALAASGDSRRRLEAEIDEIKGDAARLQAELIESAARARAAEERIGTVEQRLQTLTASEDAIRRSLAARRQVIGEVLAALQRMGRRPPPAVLVEPKDMLAALRTAMLLGAVVPELRAEASALSTDLAELVRLKAAIVSDREALRRELAELRAEQERLGVFTAARQARLAEAEQSFAAERERAAGLAAQAKSLKELIETMERELSPAKRAEDAPQLTERQAREARERVAATALRDPARLAPKVPFSETKGLLPRPVGGRMIREFGAEDGYGGSARGASIVARPRAVVTSPADGWVAFAGPFRSFGRLLIINAGGGYYLLLAGMDHINVEVGQFVLAGEPVAVMGDATPPQPAAGSVEANDPVLYVEFRKDGSSIDPGPWWAKSQGEKVRG
jgi:septal ring factor EnvC (AmiA/AmiB activator)